MSEKSNQKWGVWKKYKKGAGWPYKGLVYRKGVQSFCTLWSCLECYKITLYAALSETLISNVKAEI